MARHVKELVFVPHGAVELVTDDDEVIWASDSDPDFRDDFSDEFLNADDHGDDILEWLVENDIITEEESDDLEIVEESLEGDEEAPVNGTLETDADFEDDEK